jgi:hypothetical protein
MLSFLIQNPFFPSFFYQKRKKDKESWHKGRIPLCIPFQLAKLSPSALCASGLRTLLAKVKNIFNNS